jgi:methionyl-tRNA formyltransferase
MSVIFFGSSAFSVPSLLGLRDSVSHVVTRKTKPKGRGYLLEDNAVKKAALSIGIPVIEIDSFKDEAAKGIAELAPELVVVASFGLIIPRWFLEIPAIGSLNVHPSLLPKYRGPAPMQWTIWNGEKETGVTIIEMNERMDAGDIVHQEQTAMAPEEDAESLSDRLSRRAGELLPGIVGDAAANGIHGVPQRDDEATYTPMITKEMGQIDWHVSCIEVIQQIRALVLWPTACTTLEGKVLKVFKVRTGSDQSTGAEPGTITGVTSEGIVVACTEGTVTLREVQLENRKRMAAGDFARGYRQIIGKQLK